MFGPQYGYVTFRLIEVWIDDPAPVPRNVPDVGAAVRGLAPADRVT